MNSVSELERGHFHMSNVNVKIVTGSKENSESVGQLTSTSPTGGSECKRQIKPRRPAGGIHTKFVCWFYLIAVTATAAQIFTRGPMGNAGGARGQNIYHVTLWHHVICSSRYGSTFTIRWI